MARVGMKTYRSSLLPGQIFYSPGSRDAAELAYKKNLRATDPSNQGNLYRQILGQGTTGRWTGQGFGSPEANAWEMAGLLAGAGITDLKDFGKIQVPQKTPRQVQPEYRAEGETGIGYPTGRYYYYSENGDPVYVDSTKVYSAPQNYDPATGASYGDNYLIDDVSYRDIWGNKKTGQPIYQNYDQVYGDTWQGTYTGEGRTNFGVQFAPDGTPYFYTQFGGDTSSMGDILPIVSIALTLFAPGIGGAIGSAITGTAATTVASQVIGSAVVQGVLAEAQGGDFLDGAIKGAITAGVAPAVANTVGTAVADVLADSAIKNVVANAVASSASSAVTAALTGGDVEQAALTGALAGAGGSIGREFATAADLGTTPFSEQTQMLAGQEQGLGTAGGVGANIGQAAGAIAAGADPTQTVLQAISKTVAEKQAATPKTVEENISQTPVSPPPGAEIAAAPPPETGQIADTGVMDGVAGTIPEITPPSTQEIPIPDQISQELGGVEEGVAGTIPPLDQDIIDLITQPPVTEQNLALDVLGQPLTPEAVDITPVPQENLALDVLGQPLTPEAVDIEPIPQDPLLGLSSQAAGEAEQEAIDYQALEGLSDPSVGFGEEAAIDQANLDALGDLSSAEVGLGEQEAIDRQALEELSSPEVGLGEQEAIAQATPEFQTTPFIRDTYISSGRRQPVMGPTVTTLGQAISAPFFPSSPVSGLTSYRGAGEIESKSTGKPRRDVWNEASLRLKDALGL